ncbi:DUF998 domain-containing protein [Herbiconiux daphne]|uniref:DUF998 domain-containing protein n=1 Tax=Herbiconiux daphne TaxID=2970914 RepID=A0ABT2H595_9MICO|nr:DUF998 domain-containing protein [Herbiconiux daphne]MCS5735104.1 DUF998 domain-containing protein [Herbiconiux daphne]
MAHFTRYALVGGVVAAPLFITLWALQAVTRDGFRPTYHPLSLLSLGEAGWVQITNFILTGLLLVGAAIGLRRAGGAGAGSRSTAVLVGLMGSGLVIAGIFVTDAGAGFPAGAPAGAPVMSWHGAVHELGFVLTQLSFVALTIVLAVRFGRARQRGWLIASILAVVGALVVAVVGSPETMAIRLVFSSAIELGFVAAIAAQTLRQQTSSRVDQIEAHRAGRRLGTPLR